MTKTRDLANLIADSKVGPSEIDTAGNYTMNNLTSTGRIVGVDLDLYANTDGNNSLRFYDDDDLLTGGIYPWSGRLNISSYNSQDIALSPAANVNITSGNLQMGGTTVLSSTQNLYLSGQIDQTKNSNGSYINQFENENTGSSAYVETQWINSNSQLRLGTSRYYADPWQGAWVYADTQDLLIKAGGSGKAIKFYAGNVDDIRASITSSSLNLNIDATIKLSNYNTPAFAIQRYNNAALDLFAFGEMDGGTGTPWGGSSWGAAVIHTHNRNMVFSTASSDFTDLVDGDAAMVITYDDLVGINISNPSAPLHVDAGGSNPGGIIESNTTTGAWLALRTGQTGGDHFKVGTNATGFHVYNETDAATRLFISKSNGEVGIGTTDTDAKLHVTNSISADGDTYDNPIAILQNTRVNTGSGAATLRFDTNEITGSSQYKRAAISAEYDGSNNLSGRLLFGTADSSGTMRTRMRLDGNNEVKVGNNSTYTYLKVEGADANVAANIQLTHLGGGSRTGIDAIWNISRGSNETNFGTGVTTGSTALGGLVFWNTTTGVGSLDVMRLTDDGYAHFAKTVKQTYVIGGFVPNGGSLTTAKKAQIHALWASSSDRTGWGKISTHGNGNHYGALYGSNSYIYWDLYVEDCTYLNTTIAWHNNADSSTRTVNLDWTEDGGSVWNTNQTTFGSSGGTNQSFTIQPNGTGGRYIRVRAKMNSSHYQLVGILGIEFTAAATHFQFCNALGN